MTCQARIGTSMASWAPRRGARCGQANTSTVLVVTHPNGVPGRGRDVELCVQHTRSLVAAEKRGEAAVGALLTKWGIE